MAVIAPPPYRPKGRSPGSPSPGAKPVAAPRIDDRHWLERLTRSGYFIGAILLHLIIFLIVATWVVFKAPTPPPDDFAKSYIPQGAPPPPPPQVQEPIQVPTPSAAPSAIRTQSAMPTLNIPMPSIDTAQILQKATRTVTKVAPKLTNNLASRLSAIMATETKWGRDASNIRNSDGDPKNVVATFPVYVASYADGDWDCNLAVRDGTIVAGSMPNLVAKVNEWSHGNLRGQVVPTPLDIASPDLLAKMPPFIFFTGHKDFHLTPQEIQNLAQYLQNGGAIWGDNALAGKGSRFDVAFRREMKLVIPDADKNFEVVPLTHEIFAKSWFPLSKVPEGMNYYAEPLEHIDIDGKIAVIYTPNDYSDLFFLRINVGDQTEAPTFPTPDSPLFTNRLFHVDSAVFFRNFTLEGSLAAHQLGMNIIGFLLVRFDKDLMLTN